MVNVKNILSFFNSTQWKLKLFILLAFVLFFITAPFFNFRYFDSANWATIEAQSKNLLAPLVDIQDSHVEKMAFRLTVPFLGYVFHLNRFGLYALQVVSSSLILYFSIALAYKISHNKFITTLFCCSLTGCYFMYGGYYDVFGRPDAFPILFLLLAMYFNNPVAVFLFSFTAFWCDERSILNIGWVYLFHLTNFICKQKISSFKITTLLNTATKWLPLAASLFLYVGLRLFLQFNFGFHTGHSDVGPEVLIQNSKYIAPAIFSAYGSVWAIALTATYLLLRHNRLLLLLCLMQFGLSFLSAVLVFDISRSIAFAFPMVFAALHICRFYLPIPTLKTLLQTCAIAVFFIPIIIWDANYHYLPALPLRLVQFWVLKS